MCTVLRVRQHLFSFQIIKNRNGGISRIFKMLQSTLFQPSTSITISSGRFLHLEIYFKLEINLCFFSYVLFACKKYLGVKNLGLIMSIKLLHIFISASKIFRNNINNNLYHIYTFFCIHSSWKNRRRLFLRFYL